MCQQGKPQPAYMLVDYIHREQGRGGGAEEGWELRDNTLFMGVKSLGVGSVIFGTKKNDTKPAPSRLFQTDAFQRAASGLCSRTGCTVYILYSSSCKQLRLRITEME